MNKRINTVKSSIKKSLSNIDDPQTINTHSTSHSGSSHFILSVCC